MSKTAVSCLRYYFKMFDFCRHNSILKRLQCLQCPGSAYASKDYPTTKALILFYVVMVVALLLVTYVPAFAMTLPNLLMH